MEVVAYLINRYPEASLTTIRREIEAVAATGVKVLRFAHRPSIQPFAAECDRVEARLTQYIATGKWIDLALPVVRVFATRPRRFVRACRLILKLGPAKFRNFPYLILACRLFEYLVAGKAEHLHAHFAQSSAVVAMLAHSLGGPRWTMTVHGPEDFDNSRMRQLAVLASAATATIAISRWAAEATRRATVPHKVNVRIVGMGVDEEFLGPPKPIDPSGAIVCVARFELRKGHTVLLEAIQDISASGWAPIIELIGDGTCRNELELEVERRGLSGQVRFLGWLTQQEVRERLDRCRFAVLPSLAEGMPVSIMEAFARARPVIATEVAGVTELVHQHENGLVVPAGDPGALAKAIETFLKLPSAELLDLGMRGRSEVKAQYDSRRNGRALASIWQELYR